MSSEKHTRSSKTSTSTPAPPGDHRKRRRNRTTQSCLNCHASKRMCDRKRPACQRCTTLGLTGLCVYEVDDPSQRDLQMDDKSILRGRIAELEGVIREMKNKPHPRWASRSTSRGPPPSPTSEQELDANMDAGPARPQSPAPKHRPPQLQLQLPSIYLSPVSPSSAPASASSCESLLSPPDFNYLSAYNGGGVSPTSSSSNSPIPSHPSLPRVMVNDMPVHDAEHFNVDSLLAATSLEEGLYGRMLDQIMQVDKLRHEHEHSGNKGSHLHSPGGGNCGCINDTVSYANILELSARLRRAVEALGRVSDHHSGSSNCELFSRLMELDSLTSSAIGSTLSPAERLSVHPVPLLNGFPSPTVEYFPSNNNGAPVPSQAQPSQLTSAVTTPLAVGSLPQWEERTTFFDSPVEDNLMSWDNRQQRQDWSQPPILM